MSQEKVDRYKVEKANRKKIIRKQRAMNIIRKGMLVLAAFVLVGWLGYSAYQKHDSGKERPLAEVNYEPINNYMSQLDQ